MNQKVLNLPILNKTQLITSYSQIRPYREGGFRIQKQTVLNKNIFHNYGHGGSGVSLSYGSAYKISDIFQKQVKQSKVQCAVLGSGVIGLITALQLRRRGHTVRIYTKKIPTFGQKINKLMMTSEIAPGFWFPYDYLNIKNLQIDEIAEKTMIFLKTSIKQERYLSVKSCQTYDQVYSLESIQRFNKLFLNKNEQVSLDLGNGIIQKFNKFTTVRIDMQLWLKQLIVQLVRSGVEFIPREFYNQRDVLALRENHIFNCTGYGSKYLFQDKNMKAYRGHIVEFPNPNPQKYNFIFGAKVGNQIIRIYAHQGRILLGLSKEESEQIQVDENIVQRLVKNYQEYVQKYSLPRPKL